VEDCEGKACWPYDSRRAAYAADGANCGSPVSHKVLTGASLELTIVVEGAE
jgi:hypothetical protein